MSARPALPRTPASTRTSADDGLLQLRDAALEIEPQIDRDLLVARAAGVQPPAGLADALHELALDEGMNVLVLPQLAESKKAGRGAGGQHIVQARLDRGGVSSGQHARALERRRPCHAPPHVVFEEPAIEAERSTELHERRVGITLEPS